MDNSECLSCQRRGCRVKMVSCLHSLCMPCLELNTRCDNTIQCPVCFSKTPLKFSWSPALSLPDSCTGRKAPTTVALPTDSEQRHETRAASPVCEECAQERSATATCIDCSLLLCKTHSEAHTLSRLTESHRLSPLDDSCGAEQPTAAATEAAYKGKSFCALHRSHVLKTHCMDCDVSMCETCLASSPCAAAQSKHSVLPIDEAAETVRQNVRTTVNSCNSDCDGVITGAMQRVKDRIAALHDQTDKASEHVAEHFKDIAVALQAREEELLQQLDSLRCQRLIPLEKQLSRLESSFQQSGTVEEILASCQSSADMLKMWRWLNGAVQGTKHAVENDLSPCMQTELMFLAAADDASPQHYVQKIGTVMDLADGAVACSSPVYCHRSMSITLNPIHGGPDRVFLTQEQVNDLQLQVTVTGPSNNETKCLPVAAASGSALMEAKYRVRRWGKHRVAISSGGRLLYNSPVEFLCETLPFNPVWCHRDMELSNGNRTATLGNPAAENWRSVCTVPVEVDSGSATLRVRIDKTGQYSDIMICACSADQPTLNDHPQSKADVFGWCGGVTGCSVSQLGKAVWRAGDIICLMYDADKGQLVGRNERSMVSGTLTMKKARFFWSVSMYDDGDQVTILEWR